MNVETDGSGNVTRSIDGRTAVTTLLGAGAAAASGAAAFSAAAGPGGAVAGAVLGTVVGAINGGLAAYDAQKANAALMKIQTEVANIAKPNAGDVQAAAVLDQCITYCLGKNAVKRNKGLANASIVGQPMTALYRAGKAIYKTAAGTKGVNRQKNAEQLLEMAKGNTALAPLARKVVEVLIMKDYDRIATDAVADAMKSG